MYLVLTYKKANCQWHSDHISYKVMRHPHKVQCQWHFWFLWKWRMMYMYLWHEILTLFNNYTSGNAMERMLEFEWRTVFHEFRTSSFITFFRLFSICCSIIRVGSHLWCYIQQHNKRVYLSTVFTIWQCPVVIF